ncbi:hypothetical protein Q5Y75_05860 [Ruegeria sp. 2205SS24-7]|uniref:hypothetical protein n=1 Tax=Ruegeria discodermiae TaxID=3064389 RepID=UPI002740B1A9|nr:hypothetical protein [Ruegeria sp. 2205SS24-7]MDP5216737.1 hypothetical protein [Ruegeria sp. 2205SS24-7]
MGEHAEYQWQQAMYRGMRDPKTKRTGPNPFTAVCPICGKKTRSLAGDPNGGLKQHMKDKHPNEEPAQ